MTDIIKSHGTDRLYERFGIVLDEGAFFEIRREIRTRSIAIPPDHFIVELTGPRGPVLVEVVYRDSLVITAIIPCPEFVRMWRKKYGEPLPEVELYDDPHRTALEWRKSLGVKLKHVAAATGLTVEQVEEFEHGNHPELFETIRAALKHDMTSPEERGKLKERVIAAMSMAANSVIQKKKPASDGCRARAPLGDSLASS